MKFDKLKQKKWFAGAVVACIGVAFYVLLTHLGTVLSGLGTFLGYFKAVFVGFVIAYILNPMVKFFYYLVFRKIKSAKTRWSVSSIAAVVTALLLLVLLIGMLIPQLIDSVMTFSSNFDRYATSLQTLVTESPLGNFIDGSQLETLLDNSLDSISGFVSTNAEKILSFAANSGKQILSTFISIIIAVYILLEKKSVTTGIWRLVRALFSIETTESIMDFVLRCDVILVNFIGQSLIDALIIGAANAIFMLICRLPYIGLVSVVVAVTNLVPNFGPIIGAIIGGFILLLVNPTGALIFLAFCVVLQFCDAYIIKPKLFSNSLGVSGLLILVSTIVLGNMFGILGILLAIPVAAILSFLYRDYFLPRQEARRRAASAQAK